MWLVSCFVGYLFFLLFFFFFFFYGKNLYYYFYFYFFILFGYFCAYISILECFNFLSVLYILCHDCYAYIYVLYMYMILTHPQCFEFLFSFIIFSFFSYIYIFRNLFRIEIHYWNYSFILIKYLNIQVNKFIKLDFELPVILLHSL